VPLSDSASGKSLSSHYISLDDLLFPHHLAFGDPVSSLKDDHIFRVGFCNIGGFPAMFGPNTKAQEIKHFMALHDINLFGGCKANLNWSKASILYIYRNGFEIFLLAKLIWLIMSLKKWASSNTEAPFGLELVWPLNLLWAWIKIPLVWVVGSLVLYLVGLIAKFIWSLATTHV